MERGFNACQTHRTMYPFIFNRSPVIQPVSSNVRHLSTFLHILASPGYAPGTIAVNLHGWKEDSMLVKRIAASTIYLQPFPSNPTRKFKRLPFKHIFAHFGYAPGTIAMNFTRIERGFNACEMPRCICPSTFNHF